MLKVGLTGGIATGKSFVLSVLRELGCEVMDADQTAREVVEPGQPAFEEIVAHFGREVVGEDSKLNRGKLGAIIFNNPAEREKLNAIVHPRVFEAQARWMAEIELRNPQAIVVIDAALMIETGSYRRFDKVVVVHCEPEIQLQRLIERKSLNSPILPSIRRWGLTTLDGKSNRCTHNSAKSRSEFKLELGNLWSTIYSS